MREVILHIGTEKTGTTSVQSVFAKNREELLKRGIFYPKTPGHTNHMGLAAYAATGDSELRRRFFGVDRKGCNKTCDSRLDMLRANFARQLQNEVEESGCSKIILSNEHCHSRLTKTEEIARIRELLERFAERVKVVVYFRRQDRLAVSHYSTLIKVGHVPEHVLPRLDPPGRYFGSEVPYYFDFWSIYSHWVSVFGKDNVCPRIFENRYLDGGDVVIDFFNTAGLDARGLVLLPVKNESLAANALSFLTEINRLAKKDSRFSRKLMETGKIVRILEENYGGRGPLPCRREAEAFFEHFREGNEKLRMECFPKMTSLFSEDFSEYPEEEIGEHNLTAEQAVGIAAQLWLAIKTTGT